MAVATLDRARIQSQVRPYVFYIGLRVGLVIGFSDVMWSQAVISAVHGTLNALFVNLVLLFFYLWMLEPRKTHRLILAVFVFALGLTNHHTLVQVIPAFCSPPRWSTSCPSFYRKPATAPLGLFFSVLCAINLFSLSLLVDISWLSGDNDLQTISQVMAWGIFFFTALISFFYLKEFRPVLFLSGALTVAAIFAIGYFLLGPSETDTVRFTASTAPHWWLRGSFVNSGWLQGLVANARAGAPPEGRHVDPRYAWSLFAPRGLCRWAALHLAAQSPSHHRRFVVGLARPHAPTPTSRLPRTLTRR